MINDLLCGRGRHHIPIGEHHQYRHPSLGIRGDYQRHGDVHLDLRVSGVIDAPNQLLTDDRSRSYQLTVGTGDSPRHFGEVLR